MPWILASAYPSDALSAGKVAALVTAVFVGLALWLAMVYLADRPDRHRPPAADGHPLPSAEPRPELDESRAHGELASPGPAPLRG
jgi:hypothetical protein